LETLAFGVGELGGSGEVRARFVEDAEPDGRGDRDDIGVRGDPVETTEEVAKVVEVEARIGAGAKEVPAEVEGIIGAGAGRGVVP